MNVIIPFIAVLALVATAYVGTGGLGLQSLFGIAIPYAAILIFMVGLVYKVLKWTLAPVPFNIPTTCGQQKSLPWIKNNELEAPFTIPGVIARMALEVFLFRSLFRNTKTELTEEKNLAYGENIWLWLAGLAFHWSFLIIFLRHFRLFVEPTPFFVPWIEFGDAFFEIGVPSLFMTDLALLAAVTYLFIRRVAIPQVRYISLAADYFPLFLIFGIGITGVLMRHFLKVNLFSIKQLAVGLFSFSPVVPEGIGTLFYIHFFLVCCLLIYFPFSKLVHVGGVFLSPTRNLRNDNRARRHINPWNAPVKVHTYMEWEDEFRELMADAGMSLEKELPPVEPEPAEKESSNE